MGMRKYWIMFVFAVALVCLASSGKLWESQYYWKIATIPTVLMWTSVVLGIPSGLLLIFYVLRFLIRSIIPNANKVEFLTLLWLGIIAIVLMCLYPPWVQISRLPSSNIKGTTPAGYAFIWQQPERSRYSGIAIDFPRLSIQCFIVAVITGGLIVTLKDKKKD